MLEIPDIMQASQVIFPKHTYSSLTAPAKRSGAFRQTGPPLISSFIDTAFAQKTPRPRAGYDVRLLDLNIVRENFSALSKAFPFARCHAAVKANTAEGILEILNENGSSFEIATIEELELCLSKGVSSEKLIFSHPAKDALEIKRAYECGVGKFTTDSAYHPSIFQQVQSGGKF